jgi:hypothetical protein
MEVCVQLMSWPLYSRRNSLRHPFESDDKWAPEPTWMLWMKCNNFGIEIIACFPLIRRETHRKRRVQRVFVAAGTSFLSRCLATKRGFQELEGIHRLTDSKVMSYAILYFLKSKETILKMSFICRKSNPCSFTSQAAV